MMIFEALKVLDKAAKDANVYRLVIELSERAHQLDRNSLSPHKTEPIREVFREIIRGSDETGRAEMRERAF